jgi:hypothetical protein
MYEEFFIRQKRAELEGFAERQRLLKEARSDKPRGFRQRLAVVLFNIVKWLEPDLVQPRKVNC